jgi:hypothetical protein
MAVVEGVVPLLSQLGLLCVLVPPGGCHRGAGGMEEAGGALGAVKG